MSHQPELLELLRSPLDQLPPVLPLPSPPVAMSGQATRDIIIRPPGSKSLTNRAILLAALADGTSTLLAPLTDADDAVVMLRAVQALGASVTTDITPAGHVLRITGVRGRWRSPLPAQALTLNLNNAGTATRFLAAAALLADPASAGITIDGNARMRERPIRELVDALRALGASTDYVTRDGFPPILVGPADGDALKSEVRFGRTASSQFISALLLIAPWLLHGLTVRFDRDSSTEPDVTSESYIRMTLGLLRRCGAPAKGDPPGPVTVYPAEQVGLRAFTYDIEPDASGATYWWSAAALVPGARVRVPGLSARPGVSLQGDSQYVTMLARMGAAVTDDGASILVEGPAHLAPIDADMSQMPDAALTLAVVCCFAEPTPENPVATSTLRGLRTLRVKETDRLAALATELAKLGALVEIVPERTARGDDESLRITPARVHSAHPITFDTYDDHRMAMALALVSLRRGGIFINDPGCVAKTYPTYWRDFAKLFPAR